MKLPITIEYNSGEVETYVAQPAEWSKWERSTGKTISQAQEAVGIYDLLFLAHTAMKRNSAGKPVLPFEAWQETVADVSVVDADPKATQLEA